MRNDGEMVVSPNVWPHKEVNAFEVVWGPVPDDIGVRNGALSGCDSVLICPRVTPQLESIMQRVRALMPDSMFPRDDDDSKSLAQRLAECDYLDDIHCQKGGTGKRRIRLNATTYAQPRRITYSEFVPGEDDDDSTDLWHLFAYTQYGRQPEDWRCHPMPAPIQDLKSYLHAVARSTGKLSDYCAQHEPTACQQMIYYTLFGNCVGRHRDNFCHEHFLRYLDGEDVIANLSTGHSASGDTNSQVVGSDVLIWTDGPAQMRMSLSYAPENNRSAGRDSYETSTPFVIPCFGGTLLIYKAIDDLRFCHESAFPRSEVFREMHHRTGWRHAYVFRWLQLRRYFKKHDRSMVAPAELLEKAARRSDAERKRTRSLQKQSFHRTLGI